MATNYSTVQLTLLNSIEGMKFNPYKFMPILEKVIMQVKRNQGEDIHPRWDEIICENASVLVSYYCSTKSIPVMFSHSKYFKSINELLPEALISKNKSIATGNGLDIMETLQADKRSKGEIAKANESRKKFEKQIEDQSKLIVIAFIDMVGSTEYKIVTKDKPAKWILRQINFYQTLIKAISEAGGRVVKFIGDEVMCEFRLNNYIENSIKFIKGLASFEQELENETGVITKLKISIDYGPAYFFVYEKIQDPQGTVIDRCKRIGQYCDPSTILCSEEYIRALKETDKAEWSRLGVADLKGIGPTTVYQFGTATICFSNKVQRFFDPPNMLDNLIANADRTNSDEFELLCDIRKGFIRLRRIINDAQCAYYPRFLYLDYINVSETQSATSSLLDVLFEMEYIFIEPGGGIRLFQRNSQNIKAREIISDLSDKLSTYNNKYWTDESFEFNFSSPKFWEKVVGFDVVKKY